MTRGVPMSQLLANIVALTWNFCCSNADRFTYQENSLLFTSVLFTFHPTPMLSWH